MFFLILLNQGLNAHNCPLSAIPTGEKTVGGELEKWQLNIELCLKYLRIAGTD